MKIKVRREVVKSTKCKRKNEFFYLSDFSYGERLVLYDNGMKYAYINLLQDGIYREFIDKVKAFLDSSKKKISDGELQNIINHVFVVACDKIQGSDVDFEMSHKKCIYCATDNFEDLMAEPEKLLYIDVPNVTHEAWKDMCEEKRIQLIEKMLTDNKFI